MKGTFFKGPRVTTKQRRAKKHRALAAEERRHKQAVRDRDERCRFPGCRCKELWRYAMGKALVNFALTVSHDFHKGMGGDPTGGVSIPSLMVLLCMWRHQNAPVSMHAKTIKTVYLTPDGYDGPVAWHVDLAALYPDQFRTKVWVEVARETYTDDGDDIMLEPFTREQAQWLADLAEMER